MNINDYRRGMDKITPDTELKERIMNQKKKNYIPLRRAVNGLLAAALAAACLCTAAFAASPELRTVVLSFFRMEEREQVPNAGISSSQTAPDISQTEIGALVKAQYIKMDRYYGMSGSLFNDLTWSEDGRILLDYKFWEVQNGELIPAEVDMQTNQIDVTYDGIRYQGELYWFVRNGELFFFKGEPYGVDTRPEDEWYVEAIPDRTNIILLKLGRGRQMDYGEYHMLYHLDTGETEDILAGIEVDKPGRPYAFEWSEDMRRALVLYNPAPNGQQTWVYDLERRSLISLKEMTGMDVEFANFLDNDTLTLTAYSADGEDTWTDITCWTYDIPSGQTVKTLDQLPYYRWWDELPCGVMPFNKNCLYVSETGQVEVIDLMTGTHIPVEGFTYQKGDEFMISPSQNKLLYYHADPNADGLGITQLGVVDLEKQSFIAFDREGYEDLYEEAIGWQDDNTVSINARTLDGETRYLLLYQF